MFRTILKKVQTFNRKLLLEYLLEKTGGAVSACYVDCSDGKLYPYLYTAEKIIPFPPLPREIESGRRIRAMCGEYLKLRTNEEMPLCILVPSIGICCLGFDAIKFLADWPGHSTIEIKEELIPVVEYKVLGC